MTFDSLFFIHAARKEYADKLRTLIVREGCAFYDMTVNGETTLDMGREMFFEISKRGTSPIVAGLGDAAALALAIAERCEIKGLICVCPTFAAADYSQRRLLSNAARNLFLIVAPTVLVIGDEPSPIARRLVNQISSSRVSVVYGEDDDMRSEETMRVILKHFRNMRDTETLAPRQILSL